MRFSPRTKAVPFDLTSAIVTAIVPVKVLVRAVLP
jgi:hypothetical protein